MTVESAQPTNDLNSARPFPPLGGGMWAQDYANICTWWLSYNVVDWTYYHYYCYFLYHSLWLFLSVMTHVSITWSTTFLLECTLYMPCFELNRIECVESIATARTAEVENITHTCNNYMCCDISYNGSIVFTSVAGKSLAFARRYQYIWASQGKEQSAKIKLHTVWMQNVKLKTVAQ